MGEVYVVDGGDNDSPGTSTNDAPDLPAAKQEEARTSGEGVTKKDRVTLTIAAVGLLLSLINSVIVVSNYVSTANTSQRTTQLEAERDLDAAWDLLASNHVGASFARAPDSAPVPLKEATPDQRERARRLLRDVLIRDPANVRARNLMAWYFEASSNWQAAIDLRRQLVSERPDDPERVWALANSLLLSQRWDEAMVLIEAAIAKSHDPNLFALLSSALSGKRGTRGISDAERSRLEQRIKEVDERQRQLRFESATTSGGNIVFPPDRWRMTEWHVVRSKHEAAIVGTVDNPRDSELNITAYFLVYDNMGAYLGEFETTVNRIPANSSVGFELKVPAETVKAYFSGVGWH